MKTASLIFLIYFILKANAYQRLRGGNATHSQASRAIEATDHEFRIVGGTTAAQGKYPYMVRGGGCGGSLIAPDIVLTAAHCSTNFGGTLRIGSTKWNSGGETATVQTKRIHPNYQGYQNDYMILKLDKEVNAEPVKINSLSSSPSLGERLTVIGFGDTSENGQSSDELREVTIPYVPHDDCRKVYGSTVKEEIMLCAGYAQGGKDSCQGDSGGPIMNAAGVQVGVVSFGSGCARPGVPGVYARTSGAIGWINKVVCELSPKFCNEDGTDTSEQGDDPTAGGTIPLEVRVKHDEYPEEVSWRLMDLQGNVLLRQRENTVTSEYASTTKTKMVAPGKYKLEIDDSYGDGICCEHGQGGVEVLANGKMVAKSDGQFTHSKTIDVPVPNGSDGGNDTGGGSGGTPSNPADIDLRVRVLHDNFPEEVEWKLFDGQNIVLMRQNLGDVSEEGANIRMDTQVKAGSYRLEIKDSYGDGICCNEGTGKVRIFANGVRVAGHKGDYGERLNLKFEIDRENLRSGSTCEDIDTDTFPVNESVGDQDCEWLSENMDHFNYLCEFIRVASVCSNTCNACRYFNQMDVDEEE